MICVVAFLIYECNHFNYTNGMIYFDLFLVLQRGTFRFIDAVPVHFCIPDSSPRWYPGSQCSRHNRAHIQNTYTKYVEFSCVPSNILLRLRNWYQVSSSTRKFHQTLRHYCYYLWISFCHLAGLHFSSRLQWSYHFIRLMALCRCYFCVSSIWQIVSSFLSSALPRYLEAIVSLHLELVSSFLSSALPRYLEAIFH